MIGIPAFGETAFFDNRITDDFRVVLLENVSADRFHKYCRLLQSEGFRVEEETLPHRSFAACQKGSTGIFINYFANTAQLQLVLEENCSYFDFRDVGGEDCVTPRVTQLNLSDYGLSDVIRLPDGRLIIIDGANVYEQDVDNLFARLKTDSPFEKPVIAAWIMTHPHSDHYFCFFPFMGKYAQEVVIEKMLYNFPHHGDLAHYPKLEMEVKSFARWSGKEGITAAEVLRMFWEMVADLKIPVYTPHTGQRYQIGDAKLQFFATIDDTVHHCQNINATSLMFSMELAGQKLFFGGDGSCSDARLAERYGSELKSDILQVPHHGFGCGTAQGEMLAYRQIAAPVCLLPVEKHLAYSAFTTYRAGTNFLMTQMGVRQLLTGSEEQTLELPYTPTPDGAAQLQRDYQRGREADGALTWVFADLHTGREADYWFSILNATYFDADITAELFFEDVAKKIIRHKITGPRLGVFRVNCLPDSEVEIPENTRFAVRFISSIPVVISHPDHSCAYRSSVV